jgi:arsenate reductase
MANKTKVLFLCTGNSARSQMAEALLRKYAGDTFEIHSAGLKPQGINPYTTQTLEELGVDLSGHRCKSVSEYLGKVHFQYVIIVCRQAEESCPRIFPGVNIRLNWEFDDPIAFEGSDEEKLQKFREIRDPIDQRVREWLVEKEIGVNAN